MLTLARTTYHDYNDQHFTEELAELHRIVLSRSTVRRIRRQAELVSPRTRRAPRHRSRRERYPQAGMMLQIDGSDHEWLEGRGPRLTLIAAIDDATNEVPYALFREQELPFATGTTRPPGKHRTHKAISSSSMHRKGLCWPNMSIR